MVIKEEQSHVFQERVPGNGTSESIGGQLLQLNEYWFDSIFQAGLTGAWALFGDCIEKGGFFTFEELSTLLKPLFFRFKAMIKIKSNPKPKFYFSTLKP